MTWSLLTQTQLSSCLSVCKPWSNVLSWSLRSLQSHWETLRHDSLTKQMSVEAKGVRKRIRRGGGQSSAVTSDHSNRGIPKTIDTESARLDSLICSSVHRRFTIWKHLDATMTVYIVCLSVCHEIIFNISCIFFAGWNSTPMGRQSAHAS